MADTPTPQPEAGPAARFLGANGTRLLRLLTDKESVFSRSDITRLLTRIGDWDCDAAGIDPAVNHGFAEGIADDLLQRPDLVTGFEEPISGTRLYTTPHLLKLETGILETGRRWSGNATHPLPETVVETSIDRFVAWNQEKGFEIDPNMLLALRSMLEAKQLALLDAPPGAGKSTAAKGLVLAYEQTDRPVLMIGPSDVITHELVQESGAKRGISMPELLQQIRAGAAQPIPKGAVLVVDEAGMIGGRDMATLMEAAEQAEAKLVLIGDARQIAPAKAGQPFRVLCEQIPHVSLTRTYRQKAAQDRKITLDIWEGDFDGAVDQLEDRGSIHRRTGLDGVMKDVSSQFATWYARNHEGNKAGMVLTLGADNAAEVNLRVRDILKQKRVLTHPVTVRTDLGPLEIAENDRLMLRSDLVDMQGGTPRRFKAGHGGRVVKTGDDGSIAIEMDKTQGPPLVLNSTTGVPVAHAFALELQRVQGISIDQAYTAVTRPFEHGEALVALSRHRQHAVLVMDDGVYEDRDALKEHLKSIRPKPTAVDLAIDPRYRVIQPAKPPQASGGTRPGL